MTTKKDMLMAILVTFCLTSTLFMIVPINSQTETPEYDPWVDLNDDGTIDIFDIVKVAVAFGAEGTPINKTALLLELEARIDALNATVMALEGTRHYAGSEQQITTGNQITITFPIGMFTEPPHLSVIVYVMTGAHTGKTCYIQSMSVGTASATLDLQAWDGAAYQDMGDSELVQVSYTAVET